MFQVSACTEREPLIRKTGTQLRFRFCCLGYYCILKDGGTTRDQRPICAGNRTMSSDRHVSWGIANGRIHGPWGEFRELRVNCVDVGADLRSKATFFNTMNLRKSSKYPGNGREESLQPGIFSLAGHVQETFDRLAPRTRLNPPQLPLRAGLRPSGSATATPLILSTDADAKSVADESRFQEARPLGIDSPRLARGFGVRRVVTISRVRRSGAQGTGAATPSAVVAGADCQPIWGRSPCCGTSSSL